MRYKVLWMLSAVGGLLALSVAAFVGGSYVLSDLSDCGGRERAIVEEYPHHGDRHIATHPWTFSCSVRYTTDAGRKEVLGYYDGLLRREGWEVMGFQTVSGRAHVSGRQLSDFGTSPSRPAASSWPVGAATGTGSATGLPTRRTRTYRTTRPSSWSRPTTTRRPQAASRISGLRAPR